MLAKERLDELKRLVDHFEARRLRAVERLVAADRKGRWYFALLGLDLGVPEYHIGDVAALRPVAEPPGEVELATALTDKALLSAVGRYAHSVRHELGVDRSFGSKDQGAFNLAWWFLSALRIRTLADFLVPAVSDHSWATIAAISDGACHVQLLEDVPRARRFSVPVRISESDLDWASQSLIALAELLEVPRFRLAVDCLTTHQHEASLRMTTASLWAGVEALFGINSELRFRLSALVAAFLEPRGAQRITRYRVVKSLYDFRSRAVHGGTLDDAMLSQHIRDVRVMLSALVCKMVEIKRVPSEDEWDATLLG